MPDIKAPPIVDHVPIAESTSAPARPELAGGGAL